LKTLRPGYLGISRGDFSLNAIALGIDGYPYFIPVTEDQADRIERWAHKTSLLPIQHQLSDLTADERELLISGNTPEEWDAMFGAEDEDETVITFTLEDTGGIH
jgi:hypothetical protein